MEKQKTLKDYCKEAKKRLKSGFWQNYRKNLQEDLEKARLSGTAENKVKEYYAVKMENDINPEKEEDESFYNKVKSILDEEGEISNALGRLTDKNYFNSLTYAEKQRYTLKLSERYLKAVERYKKESGFNTAK